jgi:tetratricopeptide (TPR) repeat protein
VPKIIDFGIAKATSGGRLTNKTLFTELHAFLGTPAYTSPEQMEMSGLDVDTRSDIYSLGVLLYELLTGQPPFDPDALAKSGLEAMRRTIRETDPQRPSHRLGTLSREDRLTVAQQRSTDGGRLSLLLRGDLDWIVMHCLEKDRTRRYETASGLARDIQCHLDNEPVAARPPSSAYRLQKFIRRHKAGFAAAAAITTALITGLVVSSILFLRERVARERAVAAERIASDQRKQAEASSARATVVAAKNAQIAQFMRDMLAGVGPAVARGRDTVMLREILDQTAKRLANELKGQPEIVADLQGTLGTVYRDLGHYAKAEELVRQAVAARRAVDGNESAELAAALDGHGVLLTRLRRWKEAEAALQESLALRRKLFGNENAAVAETLLHLSFVPAPDRTQAQTEALRREVLAMRQKLLGPEHPAVAEAIYSLALAAWEKLDVDACIALHREALAMRLKLLGDEHPAVAESRFELGYSLEHAGKIVEAGETYREAFAIQRKVLGDGHPQVLATLLGFAGKTIPEGKTDETIAVLRGFIASQQKLLGADSPALGPSWLALACLLDRQHRGSEEARALLRDARRVLEKARTSGPALQSGTIVSMSFFGWSNFISGTPADGLAMSEEAFKIAQATLGLQRGAVHPTRTPAWIYLALGRWRDAVTQFEATVKLNRSVLERADVLTLMDIGGLATAYREAGRLTDARRAVEEGIAIFEADQHESAPVDPAMAAPLLCERGLLLNLEGRFAEAEASFRESLVRYDQRPVQFLLHRLRPKARATLGLAEALRAQGSLSEAEIFAVKAVEEARAAHRTLAGDRNAIVREALAAAVQIYTASGKTDQADAWRIKLNAFP